MQKYDDLPEEWKNPAFLELTLKKSVRLRNGFAIVAGAGWATDTYIVTDTRSTTDLQNAHVATFLAASVSTAMAIIGTLAIIRLRHFLYRAQQDEKNKDRPAEPKND